MLRSSRILFALLLLATPAAAQTISPLSCSISGSTITCGGSSITPATSTLTSSHLFVGDVTNTAADVALSGDATLANTGAITVTKSSGIVFQTAAFALTGTTGATVPYLNGTNTWSGVNTYSAKTVFGVNGALSAPAVAITGTISNVGTSTTNKPLVLIEPSGTTSAAWSASGTGFAVNAAAAFTGNLIDLQLGGTSKFSVTSVGAVVTGGGINITGGVNASGNITGSAGSFATITVPALTTTTAFMYFTGLSSDSGVADSTLCVATTSGQIYKGSGLAGICLGTSSIRYKHDIKPLSAGLNEIMGLQAVSYVPNSGDKTLYGFTAEQGGTVLPQLMGRDDQGRPNTFDYLGVVPVLVRAIQEQQAQIEALKRDRPH